MCVPADLDHDPEHKMRCFRRTRDRLFCRGMLSLRLLHAAEWLIGIEL